MPTHDVALVLGTRPEIIKLAPVITALGERARVIHTGQHYDDAMSGQFFRGMGLERPDLVLEGVGGHDRGTQIASALRALTEEFTTRRPAVVIVQGDTNAVSAGAQAANYLGIPVIHVEAGLRSHDRAMPEEINRLVAGALADVHCAATVANRDNLIAEGIDPASIVVTGNTVVEATIRALQRIGATTGSTRPDGRSVLATIHRPENTDTSDALGRVLTGLGGIDADVTLPLHPRTRAAVERFGLEPLLDGLRVVEPLDADAFIAAARDAVLLVSDSGGVQEECTVLKRPLLVVRRSTERPESVDAGFARLITPGTDIASAANQVIRDGDHRASLLTKPSPYGDGSASAEIAAIAVRIASGDTPAGAISQPARNAA